MHFIHENRFQQAYFLHESMYNDKHVSLHQRCREEIILWEFSSGAAATEEQLSS
jgi:hypothetical protein